MLRKLNFKNMKQNFKLLSFDFTVFTEHLLCYVTNECSFYRVDRTDESKPLINSSSICGNVNIDSMANWWRVSFSYLIFSQHIFTAVNAAAHIKLLLCHSPVVSYLAQLSFHIRTLNPCLCI